MSIHLTKHGTGPSLVFLHGWGFDHTIWESLIPSMSQSYTVYCIDIPGFDTWHEFKARVLNTLPQQFACVGWSMGGLLATRLALEHPERVTHLINITSSPCFVAEDTWPGIAPARLDDFYQNIEHAPHATRDAFIALQLPKNSTYVPRGLKQQDALKQGLTILKQWDFREKLHALTLPTTYIFGRLDSIVPAKTMAVMQTTYPHFDYHLFRKAAHAPFLSHKDEFLAILTSCMEST